MCLTERFREIGIDADGSRSLAVSPPADRGEDDQVYAGGGGVLFQQGGRFESVHVGEMQFDEGQVEGILSGGRRAG